MKKKQKVCVKTTYTTGIADNYSYYNTDEEANTFIKMCRKWGFGIKSCRKVKP
jgi:hypothetical protein